MRRAGLTLSSLAALLAQTSCEAIECGSGTHLEGNECVASLAPQCGLGTELREGSCVPTGGGAECGDGTHLDEGECVPDVKAQGNAARMYDVTLLQPADIVPLAGQTLHATFESGETLVLVGLHEPTEQSARLFGGPGLGAEDGTYRLDRGQAFDAPATRGETGTLSSEPFTFRMEFLGSDTMVLLDTVISDGVLMSVDEMTLVESGHLQGVLTPENAEAIYIEAANATLYTVFMGLGIPPTVDQDGDGDADSWIISFTFSTIPIWLFG